MAEEAGDPWARWMLHRRFGGDAGAQAEMLRLLGGVRDRVLDRARVAPGETVLDVGTGDGLIGFGARDRVGKRGQVVFSDISQDLLLHSRALAPADAARFVAHLRPLVEAGAGVRRSAPAFLAAVK